MALPEPESHEYLVSWFQELGYARATGAGVASFDWVEVQAWARLMCRDLTPFEARILVSMSVAYAAELCSDPPGPPPWLSDDSDYHEKVNSRLAAGLNQLVNQPATRTRGKRK